jgi:hypothetical protein
LRDGAYERLDLIATILLDGLVILTAVVVRIILLRVLDEYAPPNTHTTAIKLLEWVCDIGMVGTAVVFTVFDLLKRVIAACPRPTSQVSQGC